MPVMPSRRFALGHGVVTSLHDVDWMHNIEDVGFWRGVMTYLGVWSFYHRDSKLRMVSANLRSKSAAPRGVIS